MTLSKRIKRLFQADLNHVIETLECPEAMLKLSLQEMKSCIEQTNQQCDIYQTKQAHLKLTITELNNRYLKQEKDFELCLEQPDQDLIKRQLRKKLELQKMKEYKESLYEQQEQSIQTLLVQLEHQKEKLEQFVHRQELLESKPQNPTSPEPATNSQWHVSEDELELAYLKQVKNKNVKVEEVQ